jgi:hypothetical protein
MDAQPELLGFSALPVWLRLKFLEHQNFPFPLSRPRSNTHHFVSTPYHPPLQICSDVFSEPQPNPEGQAGLNK